MVKDKSSVETLSVLLLALLGWATIAQATPITNFGPDLEMTSQKIAGHAQRLTAAAVPAVAIKLEEKATNSGTTGPSLCELSNTCRTTLKVPEPQSLVMFGTGLLSMAGMIRRKLLR
jgi:hypothetical protein